MTNFIILSNTSSMIYAPKSVPGLTDVGVPNGDGDGPRTPPRWFDGYFAQFLAKILMESSLNLSPNVSVFSTHKYLLKLHKVYSSKYRGNNTQ